MKLRLFLIACVILTLTCAASCSSRAPQISIFADHIVTIAQQEDISFAEAAARVREMGYTGVDVSYDIAPSRLHVLDSLGFGHACAIAWIDFCAGSHEAAEERVLTFMEREGWPRLLLVPGFLPADDSPASIDSIRSAAISRIAAFADKAAQRGLDVLVEDFDNARSLCYDIPSLDHLFAASPQLGHVFDTGNYVYCGEDVLGALTHFCPIVRHVHLKDRLAPANGASPAIGKGIVPVKEVIDQLIQNGYKGWFTVEQYGSSHMLDDAAYSFQTVNSAFKK